MLSPWFALRISHRINCWRGLLHHISDVHHLFSSRRRGTAQLLNEESKLPARGREQSGPWEVLRVPRMGTSLEGYSFWKIHYECIQIRKSVCIRSVSSTVEVSAAPPLMTSTEAQV